MGVQSFQMARKCLKDSVFSQGTRAAANSEDDIQEGDGFMRDTLLGKYGVKQLGYYVESIEESAQKFADLLGAGPFVDLGVSDPAELLYRGEESNMRCRSAIGQLKDMQIELIEVQTDEPDVYKELGRYGLHHLCIWSDDPVQTAADLTAAGCTVAMEMLSGSGLRVFYIDARDVLGSFLEVHNQLEQLWQAVKSLAERADEDTPVLVSQEALRG